MHLQSPAKVLISAQFYRIVFNKRFPSPTLILPLPFGEGEEKKRKTLSPLKKGREEKKKKSSLF